MTRRSERVPTLRKHKGTGHAYARFNGRQVWFGRFDEREARSRFAAFRPEWEANGRRIP